jgi:Mrp family chromosome partitioning ATPase
MAVAAAEQTLLRFPDAQKRLMELVREQVSLERTYANYADRLQSVVLAGQGRSAPTRMAGLYAYQDPVSPKPIINMLVGLVLGLVLGVMSMLRTESSRQPVRSIMQLNLLSTDPVFKVLSEMRAPFRGLDRTPPEAYDALVANALRAEKTPYRVGFVGVLRDSGASTAALNYALSASRRGLDSLLVSLDPRSPNARRLGAKEAPGAHRVNDGLSYMAFSGSSLMTGAHGKLALSEAITSQERDVTVFDFEATAEAADYAFAASQLDEVVLLVRANRVHSVDFLAVHQALKDSGCPTISIVLARGSESDAIADAPDPDDLRALPS